MRGYSKHPGSSETEDNEDALDLDDTLMLGDMLAVKLLYNKDSVALAFVKIMSMKIKIGGKYATVILSINIGDFCFEGYILESHVSWNFVYVMNVITNKLCKSLDGASCVLVQLSNSSIEKDKVSNLMNQIPISVNKVSRSKLLPYDESLTECLGTEEMIDKIKRKLCERQLLIKNMRKHIGFHILNDSSEDVCGFCGMPGCSIDIIHGSGRGKTW